MDSQRWQAIADESQAMLDQRAVQISSAEIIKYRDDTNIKIIPVDVREERHYNLFHLRDAIHVPLNQVKEMAREFHHRLDCACQLMIMFIF